MDRQRFNEVLRAYINTRYRTEFGVRECAHSIADDFVEIYTAEPFFSMMSFRDPVEVLSLWGSHIVGYTEGALAYSQLSGAPVKTLHELRSQTNQTLAKG